MPEAIQHEGATHSEGADGADTEVPIRSVAHQVELSEPDVATGRFYVYALIDPEAGNRPFYIGKGFFDRVYQHFIDAMAEGIDTVDEGADDGVEDVLQVGGDLAVVIERPTGTTDNAKFAKIRELLGKGYEPEDLIRVIARAMDQSTAFAIEAQLINGVYGLGNLTNMQDGHHAERFRAVGDWSYQPGFDLVADAQGELLSDAGTHACGAHYVYVLRDPGTGEVFYVGKGRGRRLCQHFDDARTHGRQTERDRLDRLAALLERYRPNEIGRIVARVDTDELAFVIETCWIKFIIGFGQLTNIQPGHLSGMFRACDDWAPRLGFERPIRGRKGRRELQDLFLGEGLGQLLDAVISNQRLRGLLVEVVDSKLVGAGELACFAGIEGVDESVRLRVQVRAARRVQVMLCPSNQAGKDWMKDRFSRIGCFPLKRKDCIFIPGPWRNASGATRDPAEAVERVLRLVRLAQQLEAAPSREALVDFEDLLVELPHPAG